jgi:hypothetical protein
MRRPAGLLLLWVAIAGTAAAGQEVVTSPGPDHVAVTVYRAPGRWPGQALDLDWLNGFALISETRRISIPAGDSEIRFEGVAGGIQPQSAIVTGFPGAIAERNRDAYLLSATSLVERSLGRRVHLRRTSAATGAVTEQDVVIRSGADGAVVLQTAEGFEALRCTGQNETLRFDQVPPGLSARPTLSVRTHSDQPVTATVTLSYLATGFDWQANYVASLSPDGSHVDLFAWVTLASSDETSFRDANTQAVAGHVNRERVEPEERRVAPLQLRCWPQARTSDIAAGGDDLRQLPALMARRGGVAGEEGGENIVVTGSRITAPEALGDLKLYRIPEPVTVAAHSQKQVSFLDQPNVQVRTVYRHRFGAGDDGNLDAATRYLITRNRREEGLGIPLPAGSVQLFAQMGGRPILLGEGSLTDRAVGEDVEISVGEAPGVRGRIEMQADDDKSERRLLTVTNDQSLPIAYEAEIGVDENWTFTPDGRLDRRNGRPIWRVTIPANGTAILRYRAVEHED